jgi:hypothetical protein
MKLLSRVTLKDLQPLLRIPPAKWYRFGVEYKSITTDSAGFVQSGTLLSGRRFNLNQLTKKFEFV